VIELVKQIADLQRQVDGLIKPEVPLGMSLISETVLSASATSVTFSSIPQGFRSLQVITQARTDIAAEVDTILFRFNADTGANYDRLSLQYNSAAVAATALRASASTPLVVAEGANSRASNFAPGWVFIPGYASTTAEKWAHALSAAFGDVSADADLIGRLISLRWRNTAALTSLVLAPTTGPNFVSGSIFQLYGIM